jgi:protein-L-isoaspartate(D-aspartate) O-methyltransferase
MKIVKQTEFNNEVPKILKKIKEQIRKVRDKDFQNMLLYVIENIEFKLDNQNIGRFQEIFDAMIVIDRKYFASTPYVNEPIVIGRGQTISQPLTVAVMLLMLELKKGQTILEGGTGSGWNAALLTYLIRPGKVITTERISSLADLAKDNINEISRKIKKKLNYKIIFADILNESTEVWKHEYDRIIITAGVRYEDFSSLKEMGLKLLKDNGLMVFPSSEIGNYGSIELWQKKGKQLKLVKRDRGYAFVPLLRKVE